MKMSKYNSLTYAISISKGQKQRKRQYNGGQMKQKKEEVKETVNTEDKAMYK